MEVVPITAYCALQKHEMLKWELRQMCKAGDAVQRLPEPQALMTFMHGEACMYAGYTFDRNKKVIWCTGYQWIYYKALAGTADDDCAWLVPIADG